MVFVIHQYESAIGINVSPPSHYWAYILRKPELKKTHKKKKTFTPIFIVALFTIARTWKQTRCPSAGECIRKL